MQPARQRPGRLAVAVHIGEQSRLIRPANEAAVGEWHHRQIFEARPAVRNSEGLPEPRAAPVEPEPPAERIQKHHQRVAVHSDANSGITEARRLVREHLRHHDLTALVDAHIADVQRSAVLLLELDEDCTPSGNGTQVV